jgi:transcriptional repressor NrdR
MAVVKVVKRDGSEEDFVPEKIVVSCLKSGATPEAARKITKIIEGRILEKGLDKMNALDLTKWVLELLKKENEEWYRNWIIFDKAVKRQDTEKELRR